MLTGKAWPKALHGLRMVVVALLEPFILSGVNSVEDFEEILEKAQTSRTGKQWVECLIQPVIILHLYLRAERECDWLLHLYSLQRILPNFYAAGHWNYVHYIHWYLLEMKTLLSEGVFESFLNGQHVCRHQEGVWNGIFSDHFGEQTYIRYEKAKGGLTGKTLSQEQVATWTLSHHLCNSFTSAYDMMHVEEADENYDPGTKTHKEEGKRKKNLMLLIGMLSYQR